MRYLITHSLLASWNWLLRDNPYEDATTEDTAMADFLHTLKREKQPTTPAQQRGIDFENEVMEVVNGCEPTCYATGAIADIIRGGVYQYSAMKEINVDGVDILLYGRLDALKAGTIYDIKNVSKYERGKYFDYTQHPIYLELVPEAERFIYLVSDGNSVWKEEYRRDETFSIVPVISDFLRWLTQTGLMDTYKENWHERQNT